MANNQLPTKINKANNGEQLNSYLNLLNKAQIPEENPEQNNKMDGIAFITLFTCAALLDLIDLIEFSGIGIAISFIASLLIGLVFNVLLFVACQKTNMKTATKLATILGNYIIESVPGIDVLPINIIAVIICYVLSNPEATQKIKQVLSTASKVAKVIPQTKPIRPIINATESLNQFSTTSSGLSNGQQILSKSDIVSPKIIKAQNYE